jgi:hypothetical protein
MSWTRHKKEVQNQAIVDDYFIERDKGTSAERAQKLVALKHGIAIIRVEYSLRWYYQEAVRRKKYGFLQKFPPEKEHIVQFDTIFAADFEKGVNNYQQLTNNYFSPRLNGFFLRSTINNN